MEPKPIHIDLHPLHPDMMWAANEVANLMLLNAELVTAADAHDDAAPLETEALRTKLNELVDHLLSPLNRLTAAAESPDDVEDWPALIHSVRADQASGFGTMFDSLRHLAIATVQVMVHDGFDVDELTLMSRLVHQLWPHITLKGVTFHEDDE